MSAVTPTRSTARWPWVVFASFVVLAAVGLWLVVRNQRALAEQVPFALAFGMFGLVGAVICGRDPRNRIGLMTLVASTATALAFVGEQLTILLGEAGADPPVAVVAAIVSPIGWLLGPLAVLFLLPLLFPDGRPPSPRCRIVLWVEVAFLAFMAVALVLGEEVLAEESFEDIGSVATVRGIENPLYVPWIGSLPSLDPVVFAAFVTFFLLGVVAIVQRFRRSQGVERQQIKWVAFGVSVAFVGTFVSEPIQDEAWSAIVSGLSFSAFPISIAVAVLRYRLYDLDVVVRKTVLYAALAASATLVYLAVVVGLGTWLGRGSSTLTIVAAVVIALAFQPARARLTRLADRLVYGRRATPYEVLAEFSERVGGVFADEDVLPRMARVLGEGVGAERADVWLGVDDELRDVAAWPSGSAPAPSVPIGRGAPPDELEQADRWFPVEHGGELLGVLAVRKPPSDPLTSADEKLIADLAAQARLVLRNVRLTEELRARLDELRAAQRRLVAAQDGERRRLERNIHDGAQQQLVALAVKARLARSLTERDPAKAAEMLGQIEGGTQEALEDLRDLARGIYPPLLADKGLPAALEAQARKSPMPVSVRAEGIGRLPEAVEAAVYFSTLEALQNAAKYAAASGAVVTLQRRNGSIDFSVSDDGVGFDPAAIGYGTGLQGIADRLGALDGGLEVTSEVGAGTQVRGRVPVPAADQGSER